MVRANDYSKRPHRYDDLNELHKAMAERSPEWRGLSDWYAQKIAEAGGAQKFNDSLTAAKKMRIDAMFEAVWDKHPDLKAEKDRLCAKALQIHKAA